MKKILLTLMLAVVTLSASAEFRWGPIAGVNINNYYWKQPLLHSDYRCGANVGLLGELMIPGVGFGVDVALKYNMRSATANLGDYKIWQSDGYENMTFTLHSIQVPVNLRFKYTRLEGVEHYIAPFAYVGPVFTFNVAQTKCDAIQHPAGSVALRLGLGAEILEHLQISADYQWGVTYDLRTVKLMNNSARASSWNINVAYLF